MVCADDNNGNAPLYIRNCEYPKNGINYYIKF